MKNNTLYTKCPREARYYLITLLDHKNINEYDIGIISNQSATQQLKIINNKINDTCLGIENLKADIINDIKNKASNDLIPMRELEWIDKNNKRLCYYIFSIILFLNKTEVEDTFYLMSGLNVLNTKNIRNNSNDRYYDLMKLNKNVMNINDIHHEIILFFDLLDINYNLKLRMLSSLKKLWSKISKDKYNWLSSKDEEQIDWMYSYLEKYNMTPWFFENRDTKTHQFYSCLAIIDLWDPQDIPENSLSKHQLLNKMQKSWSQKKYRLNNRDKKPYSFEMDKKIGNKISLLSEMLDINKNKLIEKLINERYEELTMKHK